MTITQKLSYLSLILVGLSGVSASSVQAGFDFVAPAVSKTAPVDDVEAAALPPQTGVSMGEVGTIPSSGGTFTPVTAHRPSPILSYPDERSVAPMAAPTPITEPAVMTPTPAPGVATIHRAPPPVRTPIAAPPISAPEASASSDMIQSPSAVYPPRGNVPARPLGASASGAPVAPIRTAAPVVSVPDDRGVGEAAPVAADVAPAPVIQPTVAVTTKLTVAPAPVVASSAPRAVVDGFGTNVPLSLALQQIIPAGLTVEDQVGLDQNMMVSWAGGRPFDKILEDMLYAHGVRVTVTGSSVVLFRATGTGVVSAVPSAPAAPAPLPERVVADVSVVPAAPAGTGPAVASVPENIQALPQYGSGQKFDASAIDLFSGRTNEPVQTVLSRWGRMSHVTVEWNVGADLTLPQSFAVNATFPRAVERLLNMYRDDVARPVATLETDPATGSAVLRVIRAGASQ